jgi:putative methyltransferase (TIGR04325 family)
VASNYEPETTSQRGRLSQLLSLVGHAGRNRIGRCYGIFDSMGEAYAHAPKRRKIRFDSPDAATLYIDRPLSARPSDYSAMYWLSPLLSNESHIFDLGGNLGHSYLTFRRYMRLPQHLKWTVCDLPAVIEKGRQFIKDKGAEHLDFTSDFQHADGCDIFLSFGALQYCDPGLEDSLTQLPHPPKHVLINRIPVWEGETYCTLEDIGEIISPYQIRNRHEFIASTTAAGYELVDSWECLDSSVRIRFHPSRSLSSYSGFYFRRTS